MDLILDADIIVAALVFFGMVDVKDTPTKDGFGNEMANNIRAVRARYFSKVLKEFILTFIVDGTLLPTFSLWSGKQFKGSSQY